MIRLTPRQYARSLTTLLTATPRRQRSTAILAFLRLLQRRRHVKLLPRIVSAVEAERDQQLRQIRVTAASARQLPESLHRRLKRRLQRQVVLQRVTDPSLQAGLTLTFEGTVVDGSLRGRLRDLREKLRQA